MVCAWWPSTQTPSVPVPPSSRAGAGRGSGSGRRLSPARAASHFADLQTAPCWVEISHDGRFLFTTNTGSGSISRYLIAPGGALTLLGTTPVRGGGTVAVTDERLSPDGRYLFVVESNTGTVGVFAVQRAELASSPAALPVGAAPAGIVVT